MTGPTLEGIGAQRPDDPRGWLVFEHLPPAIDNAECATQENDYTSQHWLHHIRERPATDAERLLLQHLGYVLPAELTTVVTYLTPTVRNRSWPQLEGQNP
ncbi:hypothetical protein ABQF17_17945 [Mycolicibacterium elephantis]